MLSFILFGWNAVLNCISEKVDKSLQLLSGKCLTEYMYCLLTLSLPLIKAFVQEGCIRPFSRYGHHIQGVNFWKQNFFLHTSLNQFLFKICTSIRHMVLIFQQKRNSDFILKSFFFTKLESADSVVVISMISNIVGPGFSSTTFACLIHLHPEMQADEIQCTIWTSITKSFYITSNLTELCMFWWLSSKKDTENWTLVSSRPYRGWTRVGEKRVQDNLHAHAQNDQKLQKRCLRQYVAQYLSQLARWNKSTSLTLILW